MISICLDNILLLLIISFILFSGLLSIWMIKIVVSARREKIRINKISAYLHNEFKKIRGPEWANKQISEIVAKVVDDVDNGSTKRIKSV